MGLLQNYETYSEAEIQRWLWLRAMEWTVWPAFVSQPIVPILFIFWPWYYVLTAVFLVGVIWCPIRYAFVSAQLAEVGCLIAKFLKWPAAVCGCVYLIVDKNYIPAAVALFWPFLSGLIGIPGKIGVVELTLAKKIGYIGKDEEPPKPKEPKGDFDKKVICHYCNGYGELVDKRKGSKKSTACPHYSGTGWIIKE